MLQPFQGCLLAQGEMVFHIAPANIVMLFYESHNLIPQLFFGVSARLRGIFRAFEPYLSSYLVQQFGSRFKVDVTQADIITRHLIHGFTFRQLRCNRQREIAHLWKIETGAMRELGHDEIVQRCHYSLHITPGKRTCLLYMLLYLLTCHRFVVTQPDKFLFSTFALRVMDGMDFILYCHSLVLLAVITSML